jgi:hypothetical protein
MQETVQPELIQVVLKSLAFMGAVGAVFGVSLAVRQEVRRASGPKVRRCAIYSGRRLRLQLCRMRGYAEAVVGTSCHQTCVPRRRTFRAGCEDNGKEAPEVIPGGDRVLPGDDWWLRAGSLRG